MNEININWQKTSPNKIIDSCSSGIIILSKLEPTGDYKAFYILKCNNLQKDYNKNILSNASKNIRIRNFVSKNKPFIKITYAEIIPSLLTQVFEFLLFYYRPHFNSQNKEIPAKLRVSRPNIRR